jgi:hypothetical protein
LACKDEWRRKGPDFVGCTYNLRQHFLSGFDWRKCLLRKGVTRERRINREGFRVLNIADKERREM